MGEVSAEAGAIGTSPSDIATGLTLGVLGGAFHFLCWIFRLIADGTSYLLSMLMSFMSQALFVIPDFTNQANFNSTSQYVQAGSAAGGAWTAVLNLTHLFQYLGFFVLVIAFTIYMGKMALGLNSQSFTILTVMRLCLPVFLIVLWPYIVSGLAVGTTALSLWIYEQGPNQVYAAFNALNVSQSTPLTANTSAGAAALETTGSLWAPLGLGVSASVTMHTILNNILAIVFGITEFLSIVGILYGLSKLHAGKEAGLKIIAGAFTAFFLTIAASHIVVWFAKPSPMPTGSLAGGLVNNSSNVSAPSVLSPSQPGNINGSIAYPGANVEPGDNSGNQVAITPLQAPSNVPTISAATGVSDIYDTLPSSQVTQTQITPLQDMGDSLANLVNSFLRMVCALWGTVIIFSVLLAKFYQIVMIFLLYFLGYVVIGLYGNPETEGYPKSFWLIFLKYHLFSPVWALALVAINLLAGVNWSILLGQNMGVFGNVLMILGGFTVFQNNQDLAALFSTDKDKGGSAKEFMRDGMALMRTAGIATQVLSGAPMQYAAAKATGLAGGAVGAAGGVMPGAWSAINGGGFEALGSAVSGGFNAGSQKGSALGAGGVKSMNMVANSLTGDAGKEIHGTGGKDKKPEKHHGIRDLGGHLQSIAGQVAGPDMPGSPTPGVGGVNLGGVGNISPVTPSPGNPYQQVGRSKGSGGSGGGGSVTAGGQPVSFTKGGWPTSEGYANINKALGTNFQDSTLDNPLEYAQRDAQWRESVSGNPNEWLENYDKSNPDHQNYSQKRWEDILNNKMPPSQGTA